MPLIKKIESGDAVVGVIGLGYVGLPLALAFSNHLKVRGYDVDIEKIERLNRGSSYILDVESRSIREKIGTSFFPTHDVSALFDCDIIIMCVPTPLDDHRIPDLSYIRGASIEISKILDKGKFVILESTTYPGTTEEIVVPSLEMSGLKAGVDFGVAFSPERIDPGNSHYSIRKIPKVVGGINPECTAVAESLYSLIIDDVIAVTDTKTAESVKMVENIFRSVNIALINELALLFEKIGVNTWEVVRAASTKPYGFMPFFPGPGIGGHCIPLDPYYLSYKAKQHDFIPRFIETAGEINDFMKIHTRNLIEFGLKRKGKKLPGSNVLVLGLSYKKNIDDVRESPAIDIIEDLFRSGVNISVYDPFVDTIETKYGKFTSVPDYRDAIMNSDVSVFLIDHDKFKEIDMEDLLKMSDRFCIVDTKDIFKLEKTPRYLGLGKPNEFF